MQDNIDASSAYLHDPMTKCMQLLTEAAPYLDDDRYFVAVELLKDKEMQKAFISMSNERRLAWIAQMHRSRAFVAVGVSPNNIKSVLVDFENCANFWDCSHRGND